MLLDVKARSGIAQAAALVTVLTTVSALLGFVRDVVIAGVFGAGGELDAYLVAQGLMNLVLALVAGAMAKVAVLVKIYVPSWVQDCSRFKRNARSDFVSASSKDLRKCSAAAFLWSN